MTSKLAFAPIPVSKADSQVTLVGTRRSLMKAFAVASGKSALSPDRLQKHMPNEMPATFYPMMLGWRRL
jgi:hypothetical protein